MSAHITNGSVQTSAIVPASIEPDNLLIARGKKALKEFGSNGWEVADVYTELKQRGWTQKQIAKEFDVSQQTVSLFLRCAQEYYLGSKRPTFWIAYKSKKSPKQIEQKKAERYLGNVPQLSEPPKEIPAESVQITTTPAPLPLESPAPNFSFDFNSLTPIQLKRMLENPAPLADLKLLSRATYLNLLNPSVVGWKFITTQLEYWQRRWSMQTPDEVLFKILKLMVEND